MDQISEPRYCVQCKWLSDYTTCRHPDNVTLDLVRGGQRTTFYPGYLRDSPDKCGPAAAWFVQRLQVA